MSLSATLQAFTVLLLAAACTAAHSHEQQARAFSSGKLYSSEAGGRQSSPSRTVAPHMAMVLLVFRGVLCHPYRGWGTPSVQSRNSDLGWKRHMLCDQSMLAAAG